MTIPTEDIRRDLRIRVSRTSEEAVQKDKPNSSAPTCFEALKIRTYNILKKTGDDCNNDKNVSPK
jgi:hypothetical protein